MPRSTLSLRRVLELLPPGVTDATLEELLFASKAEVERRVGDELELSVTPDRLDLLSEGGLGLYLQGALGSSSGLPKARRSAPTDEPWTIHVDASVRTLRPAIAGIRIRAPGGRPLDEGLLAEAVRFQEILHATVGRDRRVMSLGIYPADRLKPPMTVLPGAGLRREVRAALRQRGGLGRRLPRDGPDGPAVRVPGFFGRAMPHPA